MGRTPCCAKVGVNKGPWTPEEDLRLSTYIQNHSESGWRTLPGKAGLLRCGKSCRLRWINYLRPDVKRGHISPEEEDLILRLHGVLGNKWALIAGRITGRTDNEIKNYWNIHLSKKLINQGIDPRTHKPLSESPDVCIPESQDQDPENIIDPGVSVEAEKEDEAGAHTWNGEFIDSCFNEIAACDPVSVHHDILASCFLEGELTVPVIGNLDLSNPLSYKQQGSQELQASEMEFQNYNIQDPRNSNYVPPSLSFQHAVAASSAGLDFGDYGSDEFCSLLESFVNEQMHLIRASAHANSSVQENFGLCSNQPQSANILHDLCSLLPP